MKKIKIKLQLKTHTVRTLQVSELDQVNGGRMATYRCSEVATQCCFSPGEALAASDQQ